MDSYGYVGVWYTCSDGRVLLLSGDTTCRVAVAISSSMLSDSSELHRVQESQVLRQFL